MTISGLVDIGYGQVNAPANNAAIQTADVKRVAQNGSATTTINIAGTEDLGGGLKANFRYEINPDFVGGSGVTGGAGAQSGGYSANAAGQLADAAVALGSGGMHQAFLGLEGGFGQVKLGRVNTGSLSAWGTGSVFGTALGSGYGTSGIYSRYTPSSGSNYNNTAPTRFNGSIEYTTPAMNGFTGRVLHVPQVNVAGAGGLSGCIAETPSSGTTSTSCVTGNGTQQALIPGANRAGVTDLSLAYNNGPLNAMIAQQAIKIGSEGVHSLVSPISNANSVVGVTSKLTTLAANYNIGATTVYGAFWTEKQGTTVDVSSYMLGAKYVTGAYTFAASMANSNSKVSSNVDRKIFGLGADYALSKRSAVYARYENRDANTNSTADTAAGGATKTTHVGVRHTF